MGPYHGDSDFTEFRCSFVKITASTNGLKQFHCVFFRIYSLIFRSLIHFEPIGFFHRVGETEVRFGFARVDVVFQTAFVENPVLSPTYAFDNFVKNQMAKKHKFSSEISVLFCLSPYLILC